jgi:acetoin utilization deacetylase AcuC-like enzyme
MNGRAIDIYEVPARAEAIRQALDGGEITWVAPTSHGLDPIRAVHDAGLVDHLAHGHQRAVADEQDLVEVVPDTFLHRGLRDGMGPGRLPTNAIAALGAWAFDTATPLVDGTFAAACSAVDVALTGLDVVLAGEPAAYGLCRPPGHHAATRVYGGYCYFNNAAIAAEAAVRAGAGRVAVVDVDYHHGNGTQQIFYGRGDVLYASLHADPDRAYPYYAGYGDETGAGNGRGANLNVPLPVGVDDDHYLRELDRVLVAVDAFEPAVLLVSLGVDTYRLDPIADFELTTDGFAEQGRRIGALGRPTLVVQEGGYHVADLGRNVHAFLDGLSAAAGGTPPRAAGRAAAGER